MPSLCFALLIWLSELWIWLWVKFALLCTWFPNYLTTILLITLLYDNITVLLAPSYLTPTRERMTYDQYVPALDDRFESIAKEEFKSGFKFTLVTGQTFWNSHPEQQSLEETYLSFIWSLDFNMVCFHDLRILSPFFQ